jgi:hypothetical protein
MSQDAVALLNVLTMLTVSLAMLLAASFSFLSRSYGRGQEVVMEALSLIDLHVQQLGPCDPAFSVQQCWHLRGG